MSGAPLSLDPATESALLEVLEESRALGFLGPGPVEGQLDHALDFARLVRHYSPARALDLGSGGGLPGLVVFAAVPSCSGVLMDSQARRTAFLARAIERLGWQDRVEVHTGRAEALGREPELRHRFDLVMARSFGAPAVTAECGVPFLEAGGLLVVSEPPPPHDPTRWPADGLAGLALTQVEPPETEHAFAVFRAVARCDARYPRRDGMPAKRPLWTAPA